MYNVEMAMSSGRVYNISGVTGTEIDWMYDRMFGRDTGKFQNFGNFVFNLDELETFKFTEIEKEDENELE